AAQLFPIRVRGTQVRVVDAQGAPVAGAEIYRLPAGQGGLATPFTGQNARPAQTNGQGFLAGRGALYSGD
ncbi:MAG: hypothetical protein KDE54_19840, partial [Caldilineaceae bacterium]|nr:hypothetical protein [Caldilineaceae bacterium]